VNNKSISFVLVALLVLFILLILEKSIALSQGRVNVILRPAHDFLETYSQIQGSIPFYQSIPLERGVWFPSDKAKLIYEGKSIPAHITPSVLWPDGSVRWLSVDGVWPKELELSTEAYVDLSSENLPAWDSNSQGHTLRASGDILELLDDKGIVIAKLAPEAQVLEIKEKKGAQSDDPDYLDEKGQFTWAEPINELNADGKASPLSMRIRECIVELEDQIFTVYRVRGDGGKVAPGSELEWQLRLRVYHNAPVIRLQMTWVFHWNPEKYALASAKWVIDFTDTFSKAGVPSVTQMLDLVQGEARIQSTPDGRSTLIHSGREIFKAEFPDPLLHVWLLQSGDTYMSIGSPNGTRLGPNHLSIGSNRIEFAAWSEKLSYGLDLRRTTKPDEYEADLTGEAIGLARTVEASLCWASTPEAATGLASIEADRDGLWFPSFKDLVETEAIEPWDIDVIKENHEYFQGLKANIHFVLSSRDIWRWNGFINFGDVRTNFAFGNNPDRGLNAMHWALHGRYGWRNGSGDVYRGLLTTGLVLQDREILLGAIDYALHVADVDVCHGSFFKKQSGSEGGMHRRNKNHWSGSIQTQYTPSAGLYLAKWLTGHERISETLLEVLEYSKGSSRGSAFPASAWINHYAETHDPRSLDTAKELLADCISFWKSSAGEPVSFWEAILGLFSKRSNLLQPDEISFIYKNNFRRISDGITVLVDFHLITGDDLYLDAILESLLSHGLPDSPVPNLSEYYPIAYLLANGVSEESIGTSLLSKARLQVKELIPQKSPESSEWDYETLVNIITTLLPPKADPAYRETASIGGRSAYAPLVMSYIMKRSAQVRKQIDPVDVDKVVPDTQRKVGLIHRWTFNDEKSPLYDDIGGVTLKNGNGVKFADGQAIFDGSSRSFLYSMDPRINSECFSGKKEFTVWVRFEVDEYRGDEIIRLVRRNLKGNYSNTTFGITIGNQSLSAAIVSGSQATGTPAGVTFSDKEPNVAAISFSSSLLRNYGNGVERIRELEDISINDVGVFTVGGFVNYDSDMAFSQVFIGRIDEIRIYDKLLTLEELNSIEAVTIMK
jgi:hypothetical protein